ncbi:ABC transporter substrate-binding protein [Herbaspirillum huttiense]|jgi:carbohydrate ABC transporter substrate-binding protein, CUT1 family (TC 3.A.1.1.-)|uniref:Extracellular solute-binding protein n=7 Tax=Pseudomonadota TaxID=1224 RepID=A0AAJ2H8D2_9BURK|nr:MULTISPECIES: extracellular solute-binding protein [Herbaspirillum]MAF06009.1 sugar ABC transporter substrate-binding protein [Herbaspirillum sp.]MBO15087.1 sugar ABC transporter substrate-binding protein [Herbaspirillum sp.]MBP1314609.1 multiple sugar transport system substrate-binding protein [Herbaspirillum sp. 1130]MCO4858568.1 extracellular solute-binding protein [Herbaspirillum sp. WGmk3]MDR9836354.1 extracellular solute-binding protein [Herbaspirillum huttiense]|tara:strand:- start:89 stop:1336 length:1248 start_codon:yes stop_codon:yes gene_type:complete
MKKMMRMTVIAGCLAASAAWSAAALAGTLAVNIAYKGAVQRTVWQSTVDEFKKANPDVDVKVSFIEEEAYKVQLPGWLSTQAPDIINWHNGERMAFYASRGLLEDLSEDWKKNGWDSTYASTKEASSWQGKQYSAPTVYYSWGMFYRKDLFKKVGIAAEPKSWDEFLEACKKLKAAGIAPIAVGGRDAWTLAGWFDYLDLRINGNAFHQQLMAGDVAYTDPRVKKVYTAWKSLIDNKYFIDNALSYDLDGAQPFLFQGKAAMMLMGTFIAKGFPAKLAPEMGYFQFPIIDANVPTAEEGPTESIHIPAKARNKTDARRFIAFVGTPAISAKLADGLGSLPANSKSPAPADPISRIGFEILSNAKGGISQFYDRDMTKEMADEGMKGMQKFVSDPTKIDDVLNELEQSRKRIYKKS